jgi:hypothetical protein
MVRLKALYAEMDRGYHIISNQYGFQCTGCVDNCCYSRFYHHTFAELLYLRESFSDLSQTKQDRIKAAAHRACGDMAQADKTCAPIRILCPLNVNERCILYAHRPMICRLHGIPHQVRNPRQDLIVGPGCDAFTDHCGGIEHIRLDRTPLYMEMSRLEKELRQEIQMADKIKITVARMITLF